ncbi:uncharacterized protein LOC128993243 [Macrosteles quadrilineatus]|uniref:uncharacterized protein LOC128993243 n=1 Tax=Macrosteles quadrilineatus TaxID=74068 RepID=UPI0023E209C3|nr:uncharacterized protein LOC128993243 [Macrosteles quadrilineatus]
MGGKKKQSKQTRTKPAQNNQPVENPSKSTQQNQVENPVVVNKESEDEKKFVNLLHVYTIYKQKLRRVKKDDFVKFLRTGCIGKRASIELCKELMKAKGVPDVCSYIENVGFLSLPRLMPLIALLAERAESKIKPSLVCALDFEQTPERFKEKFSQLLVYGFWFLGRVISDSLSVKEQVNRGNMFNFLKGDMGYWWAGVKIMDWTVYANVVKGPMNCHAFVIKDPPKYRFYSDSAICNMHQHPLYFLSESDWSNFSSTIKSIKHAKVIDIDFADIMDWGSSIDETETPTTTPSSTSARWDSDQPFSDVSHSPVLWSNSEESLASTGSRDSVD